MKSEGRLVHEAFKIWDHKEVLSGSVQNRTATISVPFPSGTDKELGEILDILSEEVDDVLDSMEKGKYPGTHRITVGMLTAGRSALVPELIKFFTKCPKSNEVSSVWKISTMLLLFKESS
ncbi:unnamed protein product [Caretta caretta]